MPTKPLPRYPKGVDARVCRVCKTVHLHPERYECRKCGKPLEQTTIYNAAYQPKD